MSLQEEKSHVHFCRRFWSHSGHKEEVAEDGDRLWFPDNGGASSMILAELDHLAEVEVGRLLKKSMLQDATCSDDVGSMKSLTTKFVRMEIEEKEWAASLVLPLATMREGVQMVGRVEYCSRREGRLLGGLWSQKCKARPYFLEDDSGTVRRQPTVVCPLL